MAIRIRFAVSPAPRRLPGLGDLLDWSRRLADQARQRRRLLEMSDRQLADIGISRCDARVEAEKPWWKLI